MMIEAPVNGQRNSDPKQSHHRRNNIMIQRAKAFIEMGGSSDRCTGRGHADLRRRPRLSHFLTRFFPIPAIFYALPTHEPHQLKLFSQPYLFFPPRDRNLFLPHPLLSPSPPNPYFHFTPNIRSSPFNTPSPPSILNPAFLLL